MICIQFAEITATRFGTESQDKDQGENDNYFDYCEGPAISDSVAQGNFHSSRRRRDKNSQLIDESWKETANSTRRQLVDMCRDDAPSPLGPHLHEEGTECQT